MCFHCLEHNSGVEKWQLRLTRWKTNFNLSAIFALQKTAAPARNIQVSTNLFGPWERRVWKQRKQSFLLESYLHRIIKRMIRTRQFSKCLSISCSQNPATVSKSSRSNLSLYLKMFNKGRNSEINYRIRTNAVNLTASFGQEHSMFPSNQPV